MATYFPLLFSLLNGLTLFNDGKKPLQYWAAEMVTMKRKEKVSVMKIRTSSMFEKDATILSIRQREPGMIST